MFGSRTSPNEKSPTEQPKNKPPNEPGEQEFSHSSPREAVLASREKSSEKKLGQWTYADPSFVELRDDGKGIFKEIQHRQERAAYLVDRFLDFELVPPTVIRTFDDGQRTGSLQDFIEDAKTLAEHEKEEGEESYDKLRDQFQKMWIFDVMIRNTDRHRGNLLMKNGRIYAIDHGFAFGESASEEDTDSDLNTENKESRFYGDAVISFSDQDLSKEVIEKIRRFLESEKDKNILKDLLAEILGQEIANLIIERIEKIGQLVVQLGRIPQENLW